MDLHGVLAHSKSVEVEELWRQQQRQREELEQLHSAHQRKVSELQLTEITQSQQIGNLMLRLNYISLVVIFSNHIYKTLFIIEVIFL